MSLAGARMKISVFGLGYVGSVSAACLADEGNEVIGVDLNESKLALLRSGKSPIVEKDLEGIVSRTIAIGSLNVMNESRRAIMESDISLICVGTPTRSNGSLDLSYVERVCKDIGSSLRTKKDFHVVVVRSTMVPGSMRSVVIPTLEESSGKVAGVDFGICNNPEFLREGTAVHDFFNPPKTVIGEIEPRSGEMLATLYAGVDAPLVRTDVEIAEIAKFTDNVWHALKVCFANEMGVFCKEIGVDSHKVMDIFCLDTKLNISPAYLKPAFAFGGSCLPKDVRAFATQARELDLDLPVVNSILPSNQKHIERAIKLVMDAGSRKVGILGIAFKSGTDDLRESPMIELIERLIGKGFDVRVYDKDVNMSYLVGANRDFLVNHIPHISSLLEDSIFDVISHGDTIVIGNPIQESSESIGRLSRYKTIVDLVRITTEVGHDDGYEGICW